MTRSCGFLALQLSILLVAVLSYVGLAQDNTLVLQTPAENSEVGDQLALKGTAPKDARLLQYEVEWFGVDKNGQEDRGQLTNGQIGIRNGEFQLEPPIDLKDDLKRVTDVGSQVYGYRVTCEVRIGPQARVKVQVYRPGHVPPALVLQSPDASTPVKGGSVTLAGKATPNGGVSYEITWTAGAQQGTAAKGQVTAGADGAFQTEVKLASPPAGVTGAQYKVRCWPTGSKNIVVETVEQPLVVEPAVVAAPTLTVIGPPAGQQVEGTFAVTGQAAPNAALMVELWWLGKGRGGQRGQLTAQKGSAGPDGQFEIAMPLPQPDPNQVEHVSGLLLRVIRTDKAGQVEERPLAYTWQRPTKPEGEETPKFPPVFPGKILQLGIPKAIIVDFGGRKVEAVLGPDTAFVWGEQALDPDSLKEGFVVEVTVAKVLSPVCVIAQAIRLVEPPPVTPPSGGNGEIPPWKGGGITGGSIEEIPSQKGFMVVKLGNGKRVTVEVDSQTRAHVGPRTCPVGDANHQTVDIRTRKKGNAWVATDITIHK